MSDDSHAPVKGKREIYVIGDRANGFVIVCLNPVRVITIKPAAIEAFAPGFFDKTYDKLRHAFYAMIVNLEDGLSGIVDVDQARDAFRAMMKVNPNINRTDFCVRGVLNLDGEGSLHQPSSRRRSYEVVHKIFEHLQPNPSGHEPSLTELELVEDPLSGGGHH